MGRRKFSCNDVRLFRTHNASYCEYEYVRKFTLKLLPEKKHV